MEKAIIYREGKKVAIIEKRKVAVKILTADREALRLFKLGAVVPVKGEGDMFHKHYKDPKDPKNWPYVLDNYTREGLDVKMAGG